jgi:hypothetical protein
MFPGEYVAAPHVARGVETLPEAGFPGQRSRAEDDVKTVRM